MLSAYMFLIDPPEGHPKYLPEQIVFSGDSAGGNLALSTALWLRDSNGKYPMPGGLALLSPWVCSEVFNSKAGSNQLDAFISKQ